MRVVSERRVCRAGFSGDRPRGLVARFLLLSGGMRRPRKTRTTVPISCASWGKLGRLLDERRAGRTRICVRGIQALDPGEEVAVALRLPDEIVLSIDAVVESTRRDPRTTEPVTYLDLVGFDETLLGRLEELCLTRVA